MNIKYLLPALFVVSCCAAQAETESLTIEEALEAAYFNNKEWAANQTDRKIADEEYKQSKMMFLPSVSAHLRTSKSKAETNENYDRTLFQSGIQRTTGTNMGVTVRQNLFSGFSTVNSMKSSNFKANAAFHRLRVEEQKLIVKVIEAYTNVWFCVIKASASKKKEENLHKTLLSQQTSLEAGIVTQSQVSSADADYNKAVYERISAETELFTAESEFEKLTGLKARRDIKLPSLEVDLPKSLDKLMEQALASNSSILYYKLSEQAALKTLAAVRGKLAPSCDLTLEAARDLTKESSFNRNQAANRYVASLDVTIPIFENSNTQGNSYSQIEIANQQALKARFLYEDAVLETKKECVKNWNIYIATYAMIKSSKIAVQSNEITSESFIEAAALGMQSNTEVWTRENQLMESKIGLAESQRRKILASVNLLMQTGDLSMHSILSKIKKLRKNLIAKKQ